MADRYLIITLADGQLVIRLETERAPSTVGNLLCYLDRGLLTETTFYRVLGPGNQQHARAPISAVQGGVPYAAGSRYRPELGLGPIVHESTAITGLTHVDGTVSMSRYGAGETYGSFFICVGAQPDLDWGGRRFPDGQGAAAFGQVLEGMELLRPLCRAIGSHEFLDPQLPILKIELMPAT